MDEDEMGVCSTRAYRVVVGKPEGERPLGRHGSRWECNVKMDLKEIVLESVDWMNLAQWQAVVNTVMDLRVS
jgi:hypothetical protein